MHLFTAVVFVTLVAGLPSGPSASSPAALAQRIFENLATSLVAAQRLDGATRSAQLERIVDREFDLSMAAQLSLGSSWSTLSAEQQKTFTAKATQLFRTEAAQRLSTGQIVPGSVGAAVPQGNALVVGGRYQNGKEISQLQVVFANQASPKPVDLVVDEVSALRNYRASFTKILRADGFGGLMVRLEAACEQSKKRAGLGAK